MNNEQQIIDLLAKMTRLEKELLVRKINNDLTKENIAGEITKSPNTTKCPHCGSTKIRKFGSRKGVQRYQCMNAECKKHFNVKTNTTFAWSKYDLNKWVDYIECMAMRMSLRAIAEKLSINLRTAFTWRHKILNALMTIDDDNSLDGIVQADETYFKESQKGGRNIPRKSRKTGSTKYQDDTKRGLSKNQICVLTAMDSKVIYGSPKGYGKLQGEWLGDLKEIVDVKSILITDGDKNYNSINCKEHKVIKYAQQQTKKYNLGKVSQLHQDLKSTINGRFKGVATKYLQHYVKYVSIIKQRKDMFELIMSGLNKLHISDLKTLKAF